MNNIKKDINKTYNNIFDYKVKDLPGDLYSILSEINTLAKDISGENTNILNLISKAILEALESRDYLLVSDILIFELLPFVDELDTAKNKA